MDKNAIKKYAVWARRELISRVSQKALQYGITEENTVPVDAATVNGVVLSNEEKKQRRALIEKINDKGYQQVMEEVAYTWFNRFIALRFMEVNGYLPSHIRVFTDDENNFKPQILTEAINLDFEGLNMDKVYELKDSNDNEALFKYLLIIQCNALNPIMPRMFQKISDYTELLFPDNLLREGSVVQQMIELIPEEDWKDAVQIIGWLYQFYNIEPKADVFAKKSGKITKEEIPAATQLFTPDWIVRYMVENSLGRLWVEGHPNDELKAEWKYYLDEAEQEEEVQVKLADIRKEYASLTPEQIKCIDPCAGSGHILAYMFDVLMQIYEAYGYTAREAVGSIVENNIYGLDIDERAAQLAYFSVMMKARQYDRRFFYRKDDMGNISVPQPCVYAVVESNDIDLYTLEYFVNGDSNLKNAMNSIVKEMKDAKEYGSILNITPVDFDALNNRLDEVRNDISISREAVLNMLLPLIRAAEILAKKYKIVVTNPPYMGNGGFSPKLTEYAHKQYPNSKNDLYSIMIERCCAMTTEKGFTSLITMQSWINAPTFKKLRRLLFENYCFSNINNMGSRAFDEIQGEKVKNVIFVIRKKHIEDWVPMFVDLTGVSGENSKRVLFLQQGNRYGFTKQSAFLSHEQCLIVYKTRNVNDIYFPKKQISDVSEVRRCIATGDDETFIRFWHEIDVTSISSLHLYDDTAKWYFVADGGERRRWYGNINCVLNWGNEGEDLRRFNEKTKKSTLRNVSYMFKKGLTYTYTSMGSGIFNARTIMPGMASIGVGPVIVECKNDFQMMALVNSVVFRWFWDTMYGKVSTFETGNVGRIAYREGDESLIQNCVKNCIQAAKEDWDSFENSIEFKHHPLCNSVSISEAYGKWEKSCVERLKITKYSEEQLNKHMIDIYELNEDLDYVIADEEVTIRLADKTRDIKSLIAYAIGCMFGRYSLDVEGLAYAGGEWDDSKYITFKADKDSIIPISDDEYFEDDIVNRFVDFIEVVYGKQSLEENLQFIAEALDGSGQPRDVIRKYFMNDFYADHLKIYQKRPIYWLFDSGKKNGFKALVYMHRYQPDTIARMRTDYVHEQQSRYRTAIADLEQRIASAATSERVKLNKKLKTLKDQADEIQVYEEKIHHLADQYISIDLDDGVKVNYAKFQDVLAKIK